VRLASSTSPALTGELGGSPAARNISISAAGLGNRLGSQSWLAVGYSLKRLICRVRLAGVWLIL